jgi:hypothetical protein
LAGVAGIVSRHEEATSDIHTLNVACCCNLKRGASLKDLGRKCFGFTKMDAGEIVGIKARVQ